MIKHKVAMLGAFAVGKTSLVQRFVSGIFSERYQTTIGVRIDKREVDLAAPDDPSGRRKQMLLMVWDLQGEDDMHSVPMQHLRGSSGFFVVADGTRPETLETALRLRTEAHELLGDVPSALLLNKHDLAEEWRLADPELASLAESGIEIVRTSAKTGSAVGDAFDNLARAIVG